jgi:cobalt/nickel transport system permease protein
MHVADALISPAVGGTLWAVSGGVIAVCARKVRQSLRDDRVPLMGVLGAFVFAAQMINFSIPGTGSSGHLGGGLLLAIVLGPYAAFLVIASVLAVQAFFFADGGLLALGCSIFNMGFFPAFIVYPLIYRPIAGAQHGTPRAWTAAVIAGAAGLQLGALGVVLETTASGLTDLPFGSLVLMMLPVHLAIGVVEGLATAAVVAFVARARPEALASAPAAQPVSLRPVLIGLLVAAAVAGGAASWFASTHPDGLEWSIARVTGREEMPGPEAGLHERLANLQEKTAFLSDYGFKPAASEAAAAQPAEPEPATWPAVSAGTSVSGIVGGLMTLGLAALIGWALKARLTASRIQMGGERHGSG